MTITPTQWLAPTRVNTADTPPEGAYPTATKTQQNAAVVALTNGNYLIVWEDYSGTYEGGLEPSGLAAQIYDPLGAKVGDEFSVNTIYQDLSQQMPAITALPGGGFAVAQQTSDATGIGGFEDGENITIEIYDAAGTYVRSTDLRQGAGGTRWRVRGRVVRQYSGRRRQSRHPLPRL